MFGVRRIISIFAKCKMTAKCGIYCDVMFFSAQIIDAVPYFLNTVSLLTQHPQPTFIRYASIMIVAMLSCLMAGCRKGSEPDGGHGLQVSLQLPPDDMGQLEVRIGRGDMEYVRRCVVEVFRSGTAERVMRRVFTPVVDFGGRFDTAFDLPDGEYDFRIWSDYVRADSPQTDLCYRTDDLDYICLIDQRPDIPVGFRDAAFGNLENVSCPSVSGKIGLKLTRAVGRYTVLGENVKKYLLLHKDIPDHFPPVEELRFEVISLLFSPTSFCVKEGEVKNAGTGMTYICNPSVLPECGITDNDELTMADDIVLAGSGVSELTLRINVWNAEGDYVGFISGIPVDVRKDRLTIIRGSFLELGTLVDKIIIDEEWADDIIINF